MKDHATFNGRCDHKIDIDPTQGKTTVSIRYGKDNERRITLCFIPYNGGEGDDRGGTIDIDRHDDDIQCDTDDGRRMSYFPMIGFCSGRADIREHCTLLTLPYSPNPKD